MTDGSIVLVEDDPDDVFLTSHTISRSGLTQPIIVASNGHQALDLLLPPSPDETIRTALLLLDLNLPGIGGLDILRRVRSDTRTAHLPIIVFISARSEEHQITCYPAPIGVTRKPLKLKTFVELLNSLGIAP